MQGIDADIVAEIHTKLDQLANDHQVTIICAIESGSRCWGFPSPNSDYDVRFIYAHQPDWYIQLSPERDVIDRPINDKLDLAGWDLRKAMNLANNGNCVIQEWMTSALVYREDPDLAPVLREMVARTFNAKATYNHYRSMAKGMTSVLAEPDVKLKKWFYLSRATLSAWWVLREHSMPTTVFPDLLAELTDEAQILEAFQHQIQQKASKPEAQIGPVDPLCRAFVRDAFENVMTANLDELPARLEALGNDDLRDFLKI